MSFTDLHLTQCRDGCLCMTKTINGRCGKCGGKKMTQFYVTGEPMPPLKKLLTKGVHTWRCELCDYGGDDDVSSRKAFHQVIYHECKKVNS